MSKILGGRALVIGAGMGGLAAAGALARYFAQVVVLERDVLADRPSHRPGVAQSRHLHGLLPGGLEALCRIFPHFDRGLAAAGAVPIRIAADVWEELPGFDPFPRRDFGGVAYTMSRPLLEHTVRQRVRAHPNVRILDRCHVLDLVASADGRSITGVRCEGSDGQRETMAADLVVDASARGLLTLRALEAIGRERPRVTTVGIDRGYASTFFEIPEQRPDWKAVLTFSSPPDDSRAAYLLPVEGNRWMVSVTEMQCETLPQDHAALLEAARGLRTRTVYDAIRKAKPLGTLRRFVLRESAWRHYDTVADFPHGLIPLGDAVCRFNPIYGQGMSVAAKEAGILADLLARRARDGRGLAGVPQDYLAEIQPWIAGAWSMSAVPDLAYPQTRGERPDDLQDRLSFVAALYRLAARDAAVHRRLVEVRYLQRRADALREPDLVAKVRAEMAASAGAPDPLTSIAA